MFCRQTTNILNESVLNFYSNRNEKLKFNLNNTSGSLKTFIHTNITTYNSYKFI